MTVSANLIHRHTMQDIFSFLKGNPRAPVHQLKAVSVLSNTLFKKFEDEQMASADQAALELFVKVNDGLADGIRVETDHDSILVGSLKEELYRFWWITGDQSVCPTLADMLRHARTGPGSSLGSKYCDFYSKMHCSELTTTSALLYRCYSDYVGSSPLKAAAEKHRVANLGDYHLVKCSRLSFVPKRDDISRTICTEPSLNMYFQLGFGALLEQRLQRAWGINLTRQPDVNRDMAHQGSLDGSFATIDLSSASDSMSLGVLKEILPPQFMRWLSLIRTPKTVLPNGDELELRMVSSMGNGFTFPLETIVFSAIVRACCKINSIPVKGSYRTWSVFGDDIICRKEVAHDVLRLLELTGFTPNASKTFVEGPFRESCGRDYFKGHDVRGVYIKSLKLPQDRYIAINKLNDWSARTGVYLPRTVQFLLENCPKGIVIPPDENLDAGIQVPSSVVRGKLRYKFGGFTYRRFVARSTLHKVLPDGSVQGRTFTNPDGLLDAFLGGFVRNCSISVRQHTTRYSLKRRFTPMWDVLPASDRSYRRFCFAQWRSAVLINTGYY